MKNIKKISALALVIIGCISFLYMRFTRNDKSLSSNQQKLESENKKVQLGDFPINENGETYGISIITEDGEYIDPDLIEAIGEDNVEGYVKFEDIYGHDNEYNYKNPDRISVPLYESDGTTVIGEFMIENRNIMER